MRHLTLLLLALPLTALASDSDVVAQMGDVALKLGEVRQLADRLPPEARSAQTMERLIRTEIVRQGVAREARKQGFDKKPEIAGRMEQAADQALVAAYMDSIARPPADFPSDSLVKEAYEANKASFTTPRQYRVSQIYVAGTDAKAQKAANDLYKQAAGKNANFAAIARKASQHQASADKGGDMGWLSEKDLLPAIGKALNDLKKNEIAKPVLGSEGYHILRLADSKAPEVLPLDQVKPAIVQNLRLRKAKEIEAAYLDGLLKRTPVAVNEIKLGELLKVQ